LRVLVTGAAGFVGTALCARLLESGYTVRAAVRSERAATSEAVERVVVGEIGATTEWRAALSGVDAVIHAAARTHVLHDTSKHADLYTEVNVRGTARFARAAADASVARFIYLSSIKVNGEESARPYTSADDPAPRNQYGESKHLGEVALHDVSSATGLQVAIVRPPLVYGPEVRANFLRLLRWVDAQWPLPLGAVDNRRSLVNIWNLTDLIVRVLVHPSAAGRTWLVSDGHDLSTPELIRCIARAMARRARLLPVPTSLLYLAGAMSGRRDEVSRLCGSLTVDIAATRSQLDWNPPVTVEDAIARTVRWYLADPHAARD
jgi:nucleoside-diphosphate-sugar epimerase